ncbi:response regulator transcription factor [Pseudogracilibacillus auburnensis]|uniref:response regulator transcription factor n=1 Tax=Pseudogracilibacillus auburnensis TaxID=1494959 RepID=UPI001A95F447|nr:response regulator [Pseudogracilibacillus auburnensis]MBO1005936.1 response regulator [Pseudogracilibacillus auburnensis]
MKRLLIVDDEQIVREGLRAILIKNFPEMKIEEAKNGKLAVEKADLFMPDVVLMDIKMPGMNGIETIQKMNEKNPNYKYIMISAYAEFEYAQSAMKLGVKDYLLKPTKASDVVHTVRKIIDEIDKEKQSQQESLLRNNALQKALTIVETDVVTQLLFDHVHEIHLDELVKLLGTPMTSEKFVMSILLPQSSENLYAEIKQRVRNIGNAWVGALYGRQIPIIVFRQKEDSFRSQAITLAREILSVSKMMDKTGWFVGIGNVCDSLDKIRHSYQESLIATKNTALPVKYRFYSDIPMEDKRIDGYNAKKMENKFFDLIRNGEWQEIMKEVTELIGFFENKGVNLIEAQQRVLELLWIASRVLNEIGVVPDSPLYSFQVKDFRQLRTETNHLFNRMWQSYTDYQNQVEDDTIKQIKHYIIEHSHKEISLDGIAQKFELSPIYISKLFKEQLGINYIAFLTECRLEKAKKLMLDPEKSLKEITYEVGYQDPNYFSKVFRKTFGKSPTEYRRTLLGTKV